MYCSQGEQQITVDDRLSASCNVEVKPLASTPPIVQIRHGKSANATLVAVLIAALTSIHSVDLHAQSNAPPEFDVHAECIAKGQVLGKENRNLEWCASLDAQIRTLLIRKWALVPDSLKQSCLTQSELEMQTADGAKQTHYERLFNCISAQAPMANQPCDPDTQKACDMAQVIALFKQLDDANGKLQQSHLRVQQQLAMSYQMALQKAVMEQFHRPDNFPAAVCNIQIVQQVGGFVMSAKADPACPYDDGAKRIVENAVLQAAPLPYKGYETVFRPTIEIQIDTR
jgi:hypothetical protein